MVAGGAALLFTAATVATSLTPAFTGTLGLLGLGITDTSFNQSQILYFLGAAGVGGNMLAQTMCLAPIYCRARSGQCCLVAFDNGRVVCPSRC